MAAATTVAAIVPARGPPGSAWRWPRWSRSSSARRSPSRCSTRSSPAGVVALRLALAALMLWPFARPRIRGRSREDLAAAVALGRLLRAADARLLRGDRADPARGRGDDRVPRPARASRSRARAARATSAGCCWPGAGVAMLTLGDGTGEPLELAGVLLAGVSAVCWAGYILLTKRVGARWPGLEGLSVSLVVAALVTLPFGVAGGGAELLEPEILLAGLGLALLIPLLPYVFELDRAAPAADRAVRRDHEPRAGDRRAARVPDPRARASPCPASRRSRWSWWPARGRR